MFEVMLKRVFKGYFWGYVKESLEMLFVRLRSSECLKVMFAVILKRVFKVMFEVMLKRVFKGYVWGYVQASV